MRKMILGLALLGAAPVAGLAQTSPATPDRNPPAAAIENSTRRDAPRPVPDTMPRPGSMHHQTPGHAAHGSAATGATTPNRPVEHGSAAARADGGSPNAEAPRPGANSFTEAQARGRIEAAGFTGISELRKDDQGIWRGRAMRGGQQTSVALDYQGNVSAR